MDGMTQRIVEHQSALKTCRSCPGMIGPVVVGKPVASRVLLIGQAPGSKEGAAGQPFAWTAGRTLFRWFGDIGLDETRFRDRVYMAAVCRCYPGKAPRGGDRVPNEQEIYNCSRWLTRELRLLRPELLIPVGRLAIAQTTDVGTLKEVIGRIYRVSMHGVSCDVIPLPHPSGASTWHRTEPGKTLLQEALSRIRDHPAWLATIA